MLYIEANTVELLPCKACILSFNLHPAVQRTTLIEELRVFRDNFISKTMYIDG